MAEVAGARGPRGGGSRSSSEPDVCRALTGVAEGALPERGELQSAGSHWARWGKGKSCAGRLKGLSPKGEIWRQ